ncbi:hypothetical protein EYR38_007333 [Pleurotus pulmonarius]|nr:hypothetical protein EYR38_007333 [Pleurotus pulmonarius]
MVLHILLAAATELYSSPYLVHTAAIVAAVYVVYTFSQGKKTNRERDLHARTVLITGGLTPLGLTVAQELARRGAHLILVTPHAVDTGEASVLVPLLRSSTSNEEIFAEQCDLTSPSSIRAFCTKFLSGKDHRLDALVFAHEYEHIGPAALFSTSQSDRERAEKDREAASLSTFLIITLLLPSLLVAPVERDIRVVNVINPFYAAAIAGTETINPSPAPDHSKRGLLVSEGLRSLRTCLLTRHLQRILDALPAAQVPKTDDGSSTVPVVDPKAQKSNIVAVSVSPGIGRAATIGKILNADWTNTTKSKLGIFFYLLLQPFFRMLTKSTPYAIQSILHALFLPTPFKIVGETSSEVLKPGALYSDCAVVPINVLSSRFLVPEDANKSDGAATEEGVTLEDDGEYGGELAGRLVWEGYEHALLAWERANPTKQEETSAPDIDTDSLPQS